MQINLRPHLKIRLKQRKIPQNYPEKIISNPEKQYFDTLTYHKISIKKMHYAGKTKPMIVAYDIIGEETQIITIHPISEQEIQNKLVRGRWIKYEKG